ncbi:hypothetical protein EZV62_016315 [Acer yangbiense]|uniref:NAC domain-containing protein n=1 Tax=Acer yangbiense TaxID=1000413 RepID=A0A5C7HQ82_9ROSI|nr:hypothetical protein EZV62_016315 [Acer yangbiense]
MAASPIPVGFRFRPTDKELINHFLFQKLFAPTNPFNELEKFCVRECDLYGSLDPWDIWNMYGGDGLKDDRLLYFFTRLKKVSANGSRISRRVGSGTWAGEDSGDTITLGNAVVGFKKRFRYENKKSLDNGAWIMHEFGIDPSLLRHHQKPEDIVLCRMKKNPVAEKKKRKLQQRWCNNISDDEPCMSSKHSKLVEPPAVPIWELNSQHTVSNMVQVWQSIEPPVPLVPISDEPSVPIWVQQNQQQDVELIMNSHIAQVLPLETEPEDTSLMFDPQELLHSLEHDEVLLESDKLMADQTEEAVLMEESESTIGQPQNPAAEPEIDKAESSDGDEYSLRDDLFKDIPIADDQLLESDKLMADQTEEAVLTESEPESTVDQLVAVEIQKAVDAQESSASNGDELFWWDDMLKEIPLPDKISPYDDVNNFWCFDF